MTAHSAASRIARAALCALSAIIYRVINLQVPDVALWPHQNQNQSFLDPMRP